MLASGVLDHRDPLLALGVSRDLVLGFGVLNHLFVVFADLLIDTLHRGYQLRSLGYSYDGSVLFGYKNFLVVHVAEKVVIVRLVRVRLNLAVA